MTMFILPVFAQTATPCGTKDPTVMEIESFREKLKIFQETNSTATNQLFRIPVRVTVFRKDDGSGWPLPSFNYNNAFVDAMLADVNAKLIGTPNEIQFFRCSDVNYVNSTKIYDGTLLPHNYVLSRNMVNIYVTNSPNSANATFPDNNNPDRGLVFMNGGLGTSSGGVFNFTKVIHHELGHTLGLYHTFGALTDFKVPVAQSQADYPYPLNPITSARELVTRVQIIGNTEYGFNNFNFGISGDLVGDTPAACNPIGGIKSYPASNAFSSECFDNNPSTVCINYCQAPYSTLTTTHPLCTQGCRINWNDCTYVGDAVDYNFQPLGDPNHSIVRNFMSYGPGNCLSNFTQGQLNKINEVHLAVSVDYYKPLLCDNLLDKVEYEGTTIGLDRVRLKIVPVNNPTTYTNALTSGTDIGVFQGILPDINGNHQVKSDVRRYNNGDISQYDQNWTAGVSTVDLVKIQRHILGIEPLANGYKILAGDVNKSNSLTGSDVTEIRKLLLGNTTKFPNYDQPWRFIPECVTQDASGSLVPIFDGPLGNPFNMQVNLPWQNGYVTANEYCSPDWISLMTAGGNRNGFDAIKLGDIAGTSPPNVEPASEECQGDVVMFVPNVSIEKDEVFELSLKGYNFNSVAAFQLALTASSLDFEYVDAVCEALPGFSKETALGGLQYGKDGIRVLWFEETMSPKTLGNGARLIKVTLKAKHFISDLSELLAIDKSEMETFFIGLDGNCKNQVNLEVTISKMGIVNRSVENSEVIKNNDLFVVPNPVLDNFILLYDNIDQENPCNVLVHDMQGRLVKSFEHYLGIGRNMIPVDANSFSPGIYNVTLLDSRGHHTVRLFKR